MTSDNAASFLDASSPLHRQASAPPPFSEDSVEKRMSFQRQVSDPGPDGREQLPFVRKAQLLRRGRRNSGVISLVQNIALTEKKKPPWLLIGLIVAFNVIGKIGDAVGPAMVGSNPIALLFLNASNTHCILTTTTVSFLPWLIIAVGRRFCEDPLYFYAGWRYREACRGMLRDWSPDMADGFDKAESMFKNNLYVAVAVNPGATVCSLAGATRMAPVAFILLNVSSTAGQLLVMRYICLQFPDRIDELLGYIKQYMMYLLAIMIGITVFGALPMLRKKKKED